MATKWKFDRESKLSNMARKNEENVNSLPNEMSFSAVKADLPTPDSPTNTPEIKRETWTRKIDFLLACIGFSVGLANVWRFPFLCYRNGGGAFLIPYFIAVLLGGIPVFFLEVSLGQFMSEGGIGPWKICPLFQGIGYTSAVIVFMVNCSYNIILTWAFYYLFASFTSRLPWSHCDNDWNSPNCSILWRHEVFNSTLSVLNGTDVNVTHVLTPNTSQSTVTDPVTEFWERKVLLLSDGVGSPGNVKWDLALCLLLAWIVVYFCIWKGIKSSGKVMYFTATSPYILMFVLLIRGVTLEGAVDGIKYYLLPDWERLLDPQVFLQILSAISEMMSRRAHSFRFHKPTGNPDGRLQIDFRLPETDRDVVCFAVVNSMTSFLAGFVIFSVLGFMAFKHGISIDKVAESGPGLAFIAYPEAISQLPVSPLWSCLFFFMIILLGLDSQFVGVEGFVTAIVDMFPKVLRKGRRREIFVATVCAVSFLIGLSMITEGGMYVFQLFDYYCGGRMMLVVAFFECIVVSYIYGVDRFYDNLQMMLGFPVTRVIKICWMILTPIFTLAIFILGVISYSELTYDRKTITYNYPNWAILIGWMMAASSVILIPGVLIFRVITTKGTITERICKLTRPRLRRHQIRQNEDMSKIDIIGDVDLYDSTDNGKSGDMTYVTTNLLEDPKLI